MKTIINTLAAILLFAGIVMMAGSAGDCDGACVEQANTIGQMLMYAGVGLAFFVTGALILIRNTSEI
jgi:hypothetical protein